MTFIKEENVQFLGKEYCEELEKILAIRAERRFIYGDSFLKENSQDILAIIDGKRKRFNELLVTNPKHYKVLDELRDIVNYYIFLICIKMEAQK